WELRDRHLTVTTTVGPDISVVEDEALREEVRQVVRNELADTARVIVQRSARARLRAVLPATASVEVQLMTPTPAASVSPTDIATTGRSISNRFYELTFRKGKFSLHDWQSGI